MSEPPTGPHLPATESGQPPSPPGTEDHPGVTPTCAEEGVGLTGTGPRDPRRGGFTVLRPHARGGLGQVSLARDEKLKRQVALKEIRPDRLDDPGLRRRFVTEAEITGLLEHPGVVPVYALEEDAQGLPYYAMRFIQGRTLAQAIQDYHRRPDSLAFRELLQRLVSVCQTIAYAHSKGVIHRDLKPANVMLGDYGETLVLDWGLAKRVGCEPVAGGESASRDPASPADGPSSAAASDLTQAGQVLGTPAYMSPEQAAGHSEQVGPATDVYALGALLYEALTGRPPYSGGPAGEVLARVRAGPPPAPSAVRGQTPRPLEAVCRKAMARSAADRYGSAADLAADLNRWLADEPVSAWREPWPVRARRWLRKHPGLAAAVAAAVLVGFLGLGISALVLGQKNRELERAATAEKEAKETAQERDAETTAALGFVEDQVIAAGRPEGEGGGRGRDITLRQALHEALPFVETSFARQPLIEARLRVTLGISFLYLEDCETAAEQFRIARALYAKHRGPDDPGTLKSMHYLAITSNHLGRPGEGTALLEEVLARRKAALGPDHPDTLKTMHNLANCLFGDDRRDDARRLREEVLARRKAVLGPDHPDTLLSMDNLALSLGDAGQHADAVKLLEESLPLMRARVGPEHPDTLVCMNLLTQQYLAVGRPADAVRLESEALPVQKAKVGPDHRDTLNTMTLLAHAYDDVGRHAAALELREEILALKKARFGSDHPDTLVAMQNVIASYYHLRRYLDAVKLGEQTLALMSTRLSRDDSARLACMQNLALSYDALGRHADAIKLGEETLALRRTRLGPGHPDTLESLSNLARSYEGAGRHANALELREELLALQKARPGPDHPDTLRTMWQVAKSLANLGRGAEALALIDDCLQRDAARSVNPGVSASALSQCLRHFQKAGDAAGCRATAEVQERLKRTDAASLYNAACDRAVTAAVVRAGDKSDKAAQEAAAEADRAMTWLRQAVAAGFGNVTQMEQDSDLSALRDREDFKTLLAGMALPQRAALYQEQGKYDRAEPLRRELADAARKQYGADSPQYAQVLAYLGSNLLEQKKHAEAEPVLRDCLAIRRQKEPDLWTTFNTASALGGALLGQQKYADAEPLLRDGYEGLKAREPGAAIPGRYLPDALERLVRLYDSWGKGQEADRYRRGEDQVFPGYLRDWLIVSEPLPFAAGSGAEALDRRQAPGEADLRPKEGDALDAGGEHLVWKPHRAGRYYVDFKELFAGQPTDRRVVYAVCYVVSDTERRDVVLRVGSDDGAKVYVNGREVYSRAGTRFLVGDKDRVEGVTLKKGSNVVVFKVMNETGDWQGCLRFTYKDGQPAAGLRARLVP